MREIRRLIAAAASLGQRGLQVASRCSQTRTVVPLAGVLTAFDAFVPVFPSTSLLVALSLQQPRRWLSVGFWFAVGGTAGGITVVWLLRATGTAEAISGLPSSPLIRGGLDWVREHGAPGLFVLALLPLPVRSAVVVCALSGAPLDQLAIGLFSGRLIGFTITARMAARLPGLIARHDGATRWLRWLSGNRAPTHEVGRRQLPRPHSSRDSGPASPRETAHERQDGEPEQS